MLLCATAVAETWEDLLDEIEERKALFFLPFHWSLRYAALHHTCCSFCREDACDEW